MSGAMRTHQAGCISIGHEIGDGDELICRRADLVRECAPRQEPHHPLAGFDGGNLVGYLLHDAAEFKTGDEGALGLKLIQPLDQQNVRKVDAGRVGADQGLPGRRDRLVDVRVDQVLDRPKCLANDSFHNRAPRLIGSTAVVLGRGPGGRAAVIGRRRLPAPAAPSHRPDVRDIPRSHADHH